MNKEEYEAKVAGLKVRYNAVTKVAQEYEKDIEKLKQEKKVLQKKLHSLEQDNLNIRNIMTNNIIDSNAKNESYRSEISALKKQLADSSE